jgi:hypothetical protein
MAWNDSIALEMPAARRLFSPARRKHFLGQLSWCGLEMSRIISVTIGRKLK